MVNSGGPSKGCRTCIARKIRCDGALPVCSICEKSGRHCGGYRHSYDIIFRDQTSAVIMRVAAHARPRHRSCPTNAPYGVQDIDESENSASSVLSLPRSPKFAEQEGVVAFCTNNFTCMGPPEARQNLLWVPDIFHDILKDRTANLSVQCAGHMALARLHRSPHHFREAQRTYCQAVLALTRRPLEGFGANKDATLVAAQFLGFFEILACHDCRSRDAWATHLSGVGSILAERRRHAMETELGARSLLQSRSQMIVNCLLTKSPVPAVFSDSRPLIRRFLSASYAPSDSLDTLLLRLCTLQAMAQGLANKAMVTREISDLDSTLRLWAATLPDSWQFSKQSATHSSHLWWASRSDIYPTPIIRHVWNKYRVGRFIIRNLLLRLQPQRVPAVVRYLKAEELITDVCATVPAFYRPRTSLHNVYGAEDQPLLGTAYWLTLPLEVVATSHEVPVGVVQWIQQCLQRIYEVTGIQVTRRLADKLAGLLSMHANSIAITP